MENLRNKLLSNKKIFKELLLSGCYTELINNLNNICNSEMLKATDYDLYSDVCPYDDSVSKKYQIEYINASFICSNDDFYIACQDPKLQYIDRFFSFLDKADFQCIISLNCESKYSDFFEILQSSTVNFQGTPFIKDEIVKLKDKKIRKITCLQWHDFSTLTHESLEFLYTYLVQFDKNTKIIHCRAGVGRTGSLIMYRTLRKYEIVTDDLFIDILIDLRAQRAQMITTSGQLEFLHHIFVKRLN